jgi:hypothetical protein
MQHTISDHIRSNVIAYAALFFALSGTAYALDGPLPGQNQVGSDDIINSEVKGVDIGAGEVKNGDIGAAEVKANNIAPDSLGGTKIADRSVKNADLGLGASSSNTIADGGIQAIDVKANTLTGGQIDESTLFNDNSLTTADIDESTLSGVPATPTGPAGGDLSGTYPNPTVAGVWKLGGNSGTSGSDLLGTADNQPLNLGANGARGLRLEPASDGTNQSPNVIGGIADNSVTPGVHSATIAGGGRGTPSDPATANRVTDHQGTVGGGANNQAGDDAGTVDDRTLATVGGGGNNQATGELSTVGGGFFDHATGSRATVGGGESNEASGDWGTVGGGFSGIASGERATVGGGNGNIASGSRATVPGGSSNVAQGDFSLAAGRDAQANHQGAFVWADSNAFQFSSTAPDQFNVRSTGGARFVSGIDGGGTPTSGVAMPAGVSGFSNLVLGQPIDIWVNGARGLRIDPSTGGFGDSPNVIGGMALNQVTPGVFAGTIGGGARSDTGTANKVTDSYGTVGGGGGNTAGDDTGTTSDRFYATVGGGRDNTAGGAFATVGGGDDNVASGGDATVGGGNVNGASGALATVGGGSSNTATGVAATVGGGGDNIASGNWATVVGGSTNAAAGDYSLAAGRHAKANHQGAFVWADSSSPFDFASTAQDQFSVRSTGGARFVSAINPSTAAPTAGVQLAPGGGSWSSLSDRVSKRAIERASGRKVLRKLSSVPVSTWSYRSQDDSIRHIGPMAQDFYRAFGVGEDNKHISSVDADGVALAAIKGLSRELRAERRRRHQAELRMARLEARVAALERDEGR